MSIGISSRTSMDIRNNYTDISVMTREGPVVITVNGKEDTVLLSYKGFMEQLHYIKELEAKLAAYSHFAKAMDDIKLGGMQPADSVFAELISELENMDT